MPKFRRLNKKKKKTKTQAVTWARKGSGFILMFEAFSMLLIENEMPVNKVAKVLQVYLNRLWAIFNYWISIAHKEDNINDIEDIDFDENSVKKGHNYVTTMVDLKERRVLFATEGKDASSIKKSVDYLQESRIYSFQKVVNSIKAH